MSPSWSLDAIFLQAVLFGQYCRKFTRQKECLKPEVKPKKNDVYCNFGQNDSFVLSTKSDNGFDWAVKWSANVWR